MTRTNVPVGRSSLSHPGDVIVPFVSLIGENRLDVFADAACTDSIAPLNTDVFGTSSQHGVSVVATPVLVASVVCADSSAAIMIP